MTDRPLQPNPSASSTRPADACFAVVAGAPAGLAASPAHGAAIAVIQLVGEIDNALRALRIKPVGLGQVVLRSLAGVDTGLVARPAERVAFLFPHAGPQVVRTLVRACRDAGLQPLESSAELASSDRWPEARSRHVARLLDALASAPSRLAVDVLLAQQCFFNDDEICESADAHAAGASGSEDHKHNPLRHLLHPPTVVALGPPNIGKSTLLNALAGRHVALVADQPGTTRDHVGVMLDLAGLAVRWLDLPGISPPVMNPSPVVGSRGAGFEEIDAAAQAAALETLGNADLILLCTDPTTSPAAQAHLAQIARHHAQSPTQVLQVLLRSDLANLSAHPLCVSIRPDAAREAERTVGLDRLILGIRNALVPQNLLDNPTCWRFWDDPAPDQRHHEEQERRSVGPTTVQSPDRPA